MPITWYTTIGQKQITEVLSRAYDKKGLGHAYLCSGSAGRGKFPLALEFAQALLCTANTKPCGQCDACRQVVAHAHPDFRLIFPVAFGKGHTQKDSKGKKVFTDDGWEYLGEKIKEKIAHPYLLTESYSAPPMVDWIREVTSAIQRGSSQTGGFTVVIIEGIDNFRKESSNALLKTLEEPPENTIIILLARSLHQVLPTIKSRCQLFRFGEVSQDDMLSFLVQKEPEATDELLQEVIAESFGAPGIALQRLQKEDATIQEVLVHYFSIIDLYQTPLEQALAIEHFIDEILDGGFSQAESLFEAFLLILRESFLTQFQSSAEYIFSSAVPSLFSQCSSKQVEALVAVVEKALSSIRSHTPLLLVFGTSTLKIVEIIHE